MLSCTSGDVGKGHNEIYARIDTRHYTFDGNFQTRLAARRQMAAAWALHREQTGAPMRWSELRADVQLRDLAVDAVHRDGEQIVPAP